MDRNELIAAILRELRIDPEDTETVIYQMLSDLWDAGYQIGCEDTEDNYQDSWVSSNC